MDRIILWLVLMVVLLLIEGLTAQLTTIWFAAGALCAVLASWAGVKTAGQLLLFFGVSVILLIFTRPVALKYAKKNTRTNVDSLPGRTAVVTQQINNLAQTGQVRINDVEWLARSTEDSIIIEEGSVAEIIRVEGVRLIVRDTAKKEVK